MDSARLEIEAKFVLPHLADIRARLLTLGAQQLSPRSLEVNWRFDEPSGSLGAGGRVLRLRRDRVAHLTYKAPGSVPEERVEIALEIDNAESGRLLLEALGFRVVAAYEKFREVFRLHDGHVMLDDLPFGHFVEIEAGSVERLRALAASLGLAWDERITASYIALFEALRSLPGSRASAATFQAWERIPLPSPEALRGVSRQLRAPGAIP